MDQMAQRICDSKVFNTCGLWVRNVVMCALGLLVFVVIIN